MEEIGSSGNLTLKIRNERISSNAEKCVKKKTQSSKHLTKRKTDKKEDFEAKPKMQMKENPDVAQLRGRETSKRISPVISSSSSFSSGSSSSDSSPERQPELTSNHFLKAVKPEKNSHKSSKTHKENPLNKERKVLIHEVSKAEKFKAEKERSRGESPNVLKTKDKTGIDDSPKPQTSIKPAKTEKKEAKHTASHEKDPSSQIVRKSKKGKPASKDKGERTYSKDSKSKLKPSVIEERHGWTPSRDMFTMKSEALMVQKSTVSEIVKPKKYSKSPSERGSDSHTHKQSSEKKAPMKLSEVAIPKSRPVVKRDVKSEKPKSLKARAIIETDSDDSDMPDDFLAASNVPPQSPIDAKTTHLKISREGYISPSSSSSSASSSSNENMPSHSPSISRSGNSSDEDELEEKIQETAAMTESTLSPIDSVYNFCKNAKMSYSYDSTNPLRTHDLMNQTLQTDSIADDNLHENEVARNSPVHQVRNQDLYTSSDEDEECDIGLPPPQQSFRDVNESPQEVPNGGIEIGNTEAHSHIPYETFLDRKNLHKRITGVSDMNCLGEIVRIVHKSHNLTRDDEYVHFDLCSLDERTIQKIKNELEAIE